MVFTEPDFSLLKRRQSSLANNKFSFITASIGDLFLTVKNIPEVRYFIIRFNIFDIIFLSSYNCFVNSNEIVLKQIGNSIKNARLEKGISTDFLAKSVSISRATLWSIEKGIGNASLNTYLNIANTLGLKINLFDKKTETVSNKRSPKRLTKEKIKRNRFEVFCIETYSAHIGSSSYEVYSLFRKEKLLNLLRTDYEDLHGMGTEYLMQFFDSYLEKSRT